MTIIYRLSDNVIKISSMFAALVAHLVLGLIIVYTPVNRVSDQDDKNANAKVKVKIVEKKLEAKPAPVLEKKREKIVDKPRPKEKPKTKPPTPVPTYKSNEPSQDEKPVKPVYGLSPDSFATSGNSTVSAPMGNTLGIDPSNKGEVKPLGQKNIDLSSEARLIRSSIVIPEYTDEAEEAGIEGIFVVQVFVDSSGTVTEVELSKKVGYGMDERIIKAAKNLKFLPPRGSLGQAESGWAEVKFELKIP